MTLAVSNHISTLQHSALLAAKIKSVTAQHSVAQQNATQRKLTERKATQQQLDQGRVGFAHGWGHPCT